MAAETFTIVKRNLAGIQKENTVFMTLSTTTYTAGGMAVPLGQLGLKKLYSLQATVRGGGSTAPNMAEWDGSRTAPKIAIYDGAFVEATGALTLVVDIVARGA